MFLSKTEIKTVTPVEIINLITTNDDATVTDVINECIALMKDYLFKYYDVDAIFAATGTDRNLTVLRHLKSLVLHDLYFIRQKELPEGIEKRYDEAMRWLEKVAKGEIEADLPPKLVDGDGDGVVDDPTPFMKLGGRKTYKNHW